MSKLSRLAPAKINLMLHVIGRESTGFHRLQSLFAFVDFSDQLWAEPDSQTSIHLSGPFATIVDRKQNSLIQAIDWFYQNTPLIRQSWQISLEKNIPIAAGLGGGTSDAAAVIVLLMEYHRWQPCSLDDFIKTSGELGADVPVCLAYQLGQGSLFWLEGSGKTEISQPISSNFNKAVLLVNPRVSCSTGKVFQEFGQNYSSPIMGYREGEDLLAWIAVQRNDLQIPACQFVPDITKILLSLEAQPGCLMARMSGSGATCFGVFETGAQAETAQQLLQKNFPQWWVKQTSIA